MSLCVRAHACGLFLMLFCLINNCFVILLLQSVGVCVDSLSPPLSSDESMQKLFEGGKGSVFQRVLSWVPSHNHQLQLAGALAIANFARNGEEAIEIQLIEGTKPFRPFNFYEGGYTLPVVTD